MCREWTAYFWLNSRSQTKSDITRNFTFLCHRLPVLLPRFLPYYDRWWTDSPFPKFYIRDLGHSHRKVTAADANKEIPGEGRDNAEFYYQQCPSNYSRKQKRNKSYQIHSTRLALLWVKTDNCNKKKKLHNFPQKTVVENLHRETPL